MLEKELVFSRLAVLSATPSLLANLTKSAPTFTVFSVARFAMFIVTYQASMLTRLSTLRLDRQRTTRIPLPT